MATSANSGATINGEEEIIALLAPLTEGYPGAFGLKEDCALITPPSVTHQRVFCPLRPVSRFPRWYCL